MNSLRRHILPPAWQPICTALIGLLFSLMPLPFLENIPTPNWLVGTCVYWMLIQEKPFHMAELFVLGLLYDAQTQAALGTHAFLLIALALYMQRPIFHHKSPVQLPALWLDATQCIALYHLGLWLLLYLTNTPMNTVNFLLSIISSALAFPLCHLLYQRIADA